MHAEEIAIVALSISIPKGLLGSSFSCDPG